MPFDMVIVDEVHEMSIDTEFVMAALIQQTRLLPGLRLVLMSATAAPTLLSTAYPDHGVFVMGTEETQDYRITEHVSRHAISLPSLQIATKVKGSLQKSSVLAKILQQEIPQTIVSALNKAVVAELRDLLLSETEGAEGEGEVERPDEAESVGATEGDADPKAGGEEAPTDVTDDASPETPELEVQSVLVFVCAIANINQVLKAIRSDPELDAVCEPIVLHSSVSDEGKNAAVFTPATDGKHKIILTTNIAETSLTFPNTTHVIDTCMSREARIDPNLGPADFCLQTRFASHSALLQRRGRIGRTMDGVYTSLCPMAILNALKVAPSPDLLTHDIDYIYLRFAGAPSMASVSPLTVLRNTLTPVPQDRVHSAQRHLLECGMVMEGSLEHVTPLGAAVSHMGSDPLRFKQAMLAYALGIPTLVLLMSAVQKSYCSPINFDTDPATKIHLQTAALASGFPESFTDITHSLLAVRDEMKQMLKEVQACIKGYPDVADLLAKALLVTAWRHKFRPTGAKAFSTYDPAEVQWVQERGLSYAGLCHAELEAITHRHGMAALGMMTPPPPHEVALVHGSTVSGNVSSNCPTALEVMSEIDRVGGIKQALQRVCICHFMTFGDNIFIKPPAKEVSAFKSLFNAAISVKCKKVDGFSATAGQIASVISDTLRYQTRSNKKSNRSLLPAFWDYVADMQEEGEEEEDGRVVEGAVTAVASAGDPVAAQQEHPVETSSPSSEDVCSAEGEREIEAPQSEAGATTETPDYDMSLSSGSVDTEGSGACQSEDDQDSPDDAYPTPVSSDSAKVSEGVSRPKTQEMYASLVPGFLKEIQTEIAQGLCAKTKGKTPEEAVTVTIKAKKNADLTYLRLRDAPFSLSLNGSTPYIPKCTPGKESIAKGIAGPYSLVCPARILAGDYQTLLFDCAVSNGGGLPLYLLSRLSSSTQTSIGAMFTEGGAVIALQEIGRKGLQSHPCVLTSSDPVSMRWMHRLMDTLAGVFSAWADIISAFADPADSSATEQLNLARDWVSSSTEVSTEYIDGELAEARFTRLTRVLVEELGPSTPADLFPALLSVSVFSMTRPLNVTERATLLEAMPYYRAMPNTRGKAIGNYASIAGVF
ncbi:hypothetical protein KIPB_005187 [Kipferlia bialata]|uniref:Uncharacterized protein n=1 Tax=Kipferlia bialata TaxID=797122 RepID=A0A9K3CWU8_9EUKA|nr:hypothetical protein KIPB_005187 [Kipferlia bialata]|eukprot:g5187.t1